MSEARDDELLEWTRDWQAAEPDGSPADLRRQVARRSRGLAAVTAGEAVMSAAFATALVRLALDPGHPADVPLAIGLLGVIALAFGFSLWNRRGVWRPRADTVRASLELSLRRARRRLRGLTAGWGVLALEVLLLLPWAVVRTDQLGSRAVALLFLAVMAGGAAMALVLLGRRTRREIAELEALERSFREA
jgi:hypothetical protein